MVIPTPTSFFYEPQTIAGQEELGLIIMIIIAMSMFIYYGWKLFGKKTKR